MDKNLLLEYRKRLSALPGFTSKFLTDPAPNVKWSVLNEISVRTFTADTQWLIEEWSRLREAKAIEDEIQAAQV